MYLLEGAEGGENGTTDPDGVLPLRWGNHLDLHAAGGERGDLLAHTVGNAREHGRPTTEHNVAIQVLPDIHITLHDGVVGRLVDTASFHTYQ